MRGIDTLDNFEIYIPKEAVVKTVPVWTLPVSIQRRMGLLCAQSGNATKGPNATWISPVAIRERVCSPNTLATAETAKMNMASLMTNELKATSTPYHMAFVSSSCAAFSVLGDFLPSRENIEMQTPAQTSTLPHGTPPKSHQDAIIIHNGRIYLSLKKAVPMKGQRKRSCSISKSPASPSLRTSKRKLITASPAVSQSQKGEKALLQRFGVTRHIRVTLSRLSPEDLKRHWPLSRDRSREEAHSSHHDVNDSNGSPKKTRNRSLTPKVMVLREEEPMDQGDCPPETVHPKPPSNKDGVEADGTSDNKYAGPNELRAQEEKAENNMDSFQSGVEEVTETRGGTGDLADVETTNRDDAEMEDPPPDTAKSLSDKPVVQEGSGSYDSGLHVDSAEDATVGEGFRTWTVERSQVPAFSLTSRQHHDFDFDQSAREEVIDRIRAKLRESEAALNSLRSLR